MTAAWRAAVGGAALAVLVLGGCNGSSAGRAGGVGSHAPSLDAPAIVDGERATTIGFRDRGYLVNFWGEWCEPCKRELPRLAVAHRAGTNIVGVAVKSSRRRAREVLQTAGADWASADDPDGAIAARWGVASGFPVTIAVDRHGIVRGRHFGELSEADVAALAASAS